jgi:MFS family permease
MNMLTNYWRVVRGFNRDIWLILITWALTAFAYFGIMGVLLNLFLLRLGYGPKFIGLLIGSGQLLWAALALPAAAVGLRIGPRKAMAIGNVLIGLGMAFIILVLYVPSNLWSGWLVGWWLILWAGAALLTVNNIPYLMELSSPEERDYAFAAQGAVIALASFAGSLIAGFLPGLIIRQQGLTSDMPAPYGYALWIAPILFLLGAGAIMQVRDVRLKKPSSSSGGGARRPVMFLVFLALVVFLQTAAEGAVRSFFNVYLDTDLSIGTAQIGLIMGVGQLLPAAAALTAPLLMSKLGSGGTLSLTSLATGLFMLPLALVSHWMAAAASFVGIIGAVATAGPSRSVFSQESVSRQWRSSASAVITIGLGLGWATVAALGGFVIEAWGFDVLFLIGAVLALASALLLYVYLLRRSGSQTVPESA